MNPIQITPFASGTILSPEQGGTGIDAGGIAQGKLIGGIAGGALGAVDLIAGTNVTLDKTVSGQITIAASGGGGGGGSVVYVTENYTALPGDETIVCDCTADTIVVVLPEIAGKTYTVKKSDDTLNAVTVSSDGDAGFDSASVIYLPSQYQSVTVQFKGLDAAAAQWEILDYYFSKVVNNYASQTVSGNYTVTLEDYQIIVNTTGADVTVTIPSLHDSLISAWQLSFVHVGDNRMTIVNADGDISGQVNITSDNAEDAYLLGFDGTDWHVVAQSAFKDPPITSTNSNFNLSAGEGTVICNCASQNIILGIPSIPGKVFTFKKIDNSANTLTIDPDSGTIDDQATLVLTTQYESKTIQYFAQDDKWWIIGN